MINWQEKAKEFWSQGYLLLEDFFDASLMDELNQEVLSHFGINPEWEHSLEFIQKSATEVIPWFPIQEGNLSFEVLEKDARMIALSTAILGANWQNLYTMAMFSKQGTRGQAWHQDCPPENQEQFNLNRLVYTHDIDESSGGQTLLLPQTHKVGPISVGEPHEELQGQLVLSPKKGSLLLLHGHNWHRVNPVHGPYRISINCRAIPAGTPEDITDIAVYRNMRYRFSSHEVIEERN
ncbi:MAG: phytanoyl-CoA dioxygenase family protein [Bacteroidia bacterium]|nr:phytanoyl-CoA dioxygenase family protein [Bacteroidia bacterium]